MISGTTDTEEIFFKPGCTTLILDTCSYAPYTATEEFQKNFTSWTPDAEKINRQLKLFTISVRTEDFLYESVKKNLALFKEKNVNVKSYIVPGGHTWMNCKIYLATTLQELFK